MYVGVDCPRCKSSDTIKGGRAVQYHNRQRWFCKSCSRFFYTEPVSEQKEKQKAKVKLTRQEIKDKSKKFESHVKSAARLAKQNISFEPETRN